MTQGDMFGVFARLTIQPGRREEVLDLIRECVRAWGDTSGLIDYSAIATPEEPDRLLLTELWTDKAAHDTMNGTEPGRTMAQEIDALLTEPPDASFGDVLSATGVGGTTRS